MKNRIVYIEGVNEEIVKTLKQHVGIDNAISNSALARKCGVTEREIRSAINELRLNGFAICSSRKNEGGYYMPSKPEEMDACLAEFEKSWHTTLTIWARLRGMKMKQIIKKVQMEIKL